MASFYVLTPPGMTNPEKQTLFIRDGFSWLAFLFPAPWLLVRRLWLIAGLSVVLYLLSIVAAEYWGLDGLPVAYALILSLWTGLEGGHVRAHWLTRKGWDLKATIAAADIETAEEIYFQDMTQTTSTAPVHGLSGGPTSHPSNDVALGLIGPYGGR
jgi:hypothetical protein